MFGSLTPDIGFQFWKMRSFRVRVNAAVALLATALGATDPALIEARPFNLREFIAPAVFDAYFASEAMPAAQHGRLNFTEPEAWWGPASQHGEATKVQSGFYVPLSDWRIDFTSMDGADAFSAGTIFERSSPDTQWTAICDFNMKTVGREAAMSSVRDAADGSLCVVSATATQEARRAHLTLQIIGADGTALRSIAAHRRDFTGAKAAAAQTFWQRNGFYFALAAVLTMNIGFKVWRASKGGQVAQSSRNQRWARAAEREALAATRKAQADSVTGGAAAAGAGATSSASVACAESAPLLSGSEANKED